MSESQAAKAKMLSGELYFANDAQLVAERKRAKTPCAECNRDAEAPNLRILSELLGYPTDAYLEPPFFCDYGYNIRLGKKVYANQNLIILDCAPVSIGDNVFFGPNVVISTAGHPIEPEARTSGVEYARPISIGNNVWIDATVTLVPEVEIGDNVTIGAGSVVTKSIPANCVAAGSSCRILRYL